MKAEMWEDEIVNTTSLYLEIFSVSKSTSPAGTHTYILKYFLVQHRVGQWMLIVTYAKQYNNLKKMLDKINGAICAVIYVHDR